MASIFTRIINKELPSYLIREDDKFIAFLDINPIAEGHVLVVPKPEIDYFFDLDNDYLSEILLFAKPIAKALEAVVKCERVGLSVIGLEVPHAHLHLVPINSIGDLSFSSPKLKFSEEDFTTLAANIKKHL